MLEIWPETRVGGRRRKGESRRGRCEGDFEADMETETSRPSFETHYKDRTEVVKRVRGTILFGLTIKPPET